jgi:UDP-N-acetylglucosamine 2-epimerase (hydrolysing)
MIYKKKIAFITGTRADYGKIKSLIASLKNSKKFKPIIFATGMHLQKLYGDTFTEIKNDFKNIPIYKLRNYKKDITMDLTLSLSIGVFNKFLFRVKPDLVIVHGDRIETLAASICCNLNDILLVHIEGGEVSGTVDECIRHAVTKLSHIHFVSNEKAKEILKLLGESESSIYVTGSPEVDVMIKKDLPSIESVKTRYEINFKEYAIIILHPVVNEKKITFAKEVKIFFKSIKCSNFNYVIIFPNNDKYSSVILKEIQKLKNKKNYKILPSMRFEYYLTLLKFANFIIGNSSSGIREAPVYGTKVINVGDRQKNRVKSSFISNINFSFRSIIKEINKVKKVKKIKKKQYLFGKGKTVEKFLEIINSQIFWETKKKKNFVIYKK